MLACNLIQAREKKFLLPLPKSLKLNPLQPESDVQDINRGGVGAVDFRSCEEDVSVTVQGAVVHNGYDLFVSRNWLVCYPRARG
jgi:hypothetical protein